MFRLLAGFSIHGDGRGGSARVDDATLGGPSELRKTVAGGRNRRHSPRQAVEPQRGGAESREESRREVFGNFPTLVNEKANKFNFDTFNFHFIKDFSSSFSYQLQLRVSPSLFIPHLIFSSFFFVLNE